MKSLGFSLLFQVASYSSNTSVQIQTQLQPRTEDNLLSSTVLVQRQTKTRTALLSHNSFEIFSSSIPVELSFITADPTELNKVTTSIDRQPKEFPQNLKNKDLFSHPFALTNTQCLPSVTQDDCYLI